MIVRVTLENILSFGNRAEFSMIAGKGTSKPDHVVRAKKRDDISLLKASVIYGANASGKSNLIKSVGVLKDITLDGLETVDYTVFKLADELGDNSRIEVEFKYNELYFAYGVVFNRFEIVEEWLYEINKRTEKIVFERKLINGAYAYSFENNVAIDAQTTQFIEFLAKGTPRNRSFIAEYISRNGEGLGQIPMVHEWFDNRLQIIKPNTRFRGLAIHIDKDKSFAESLLGYLAYFKTGIVDLRKTKIELDEINDIPKDWLKSVVEDARQGRPVMIASSDGYSSYTFEPDGKSVSAYKMRTVHRKVNNETVVFDMEEESDGTLRLFDFIPALMDLASNPRVYLIDEIDRSMHPLLTRGMIDLYLSHLNDNTDSQLIITTHESNLLDLDLLRSDEVWFVEKNKNGMSSLYSMAEFKPREEIRKGYLQGRYGAIPFFSDPKLLKW